MVFIKQIGQLYAVMRYILYILLLFAFPCSAQITRTHNYLQSGGAGNLNLTVMSNVNTANSNLIVIGITSYMGGTAPVLTSSTGETIALAASVDGVVGTGVRGRIYYIYGSNVGSATHSFTVTTTGGGFSSIYVATYTGSLYTSAPLDQANTGTSVGGSATAAITPTQNGELIFSLVCGNSNNAAPTAAGSPLTILNSQAFISGGSFLGADADYIQPTAASVTASYTYVATNSVIAVASFKSAPSGNTSNGFFQLLNR